MKKNILQTKFLEELSKNPNITYVCSKVGLSRQTIYRWIKEDEKFNTLFQNAIALGFDSIGDFAYSKLFENVKKGSQRAIEFCLKRHSPTYMDPENNKHNKLDNKVEWVIIDGTSDNSEEN
jgi:predicted DNA-binding transcriptional regulator AlpA